MLAEKTVQYYRLDVSGNGADAGSGQWGEKRRKHLSLSLATVSGEVHTSSSCSPAQGDEEDPLNTIAEMDLENLGENTDVSPKIMIGILKALKNRNCIFVRTHASGAIVEEQQQRDVYERLVLYRLRAHKLSKGQSDKLDDETLKKDLTFSLGNLSLFQLHITVQNFFASLEKVEDVKVEWYFDTEFCSLKDLGDYQRLVLTNHDSVEYLNWKLYRSNFTTYKMDEDYVKFCAKMSEKLHWLKSHISTMGSDEWRNMEIRGANQAMIIAAGFPYVTLDLARTAYEEHLWSLDHDYWFREDWDSIFFEIWNLVTKQELKFATAAKEVSEMPLYVRHKEYMLWALKTWSDLESNFVSCVKDIPPEAGDDVAMTMITNAVWELPKKKMLHQYKKKKMEIARSIYLDNDVTGQQVLAKGTI